MYKNEIQRHADIIRILSFKNYCSSQSHQTWLWHQRPRPWLC